MICILFREIGVKILSNILFSLIVLKSVFFKLLNLLNSINDAVERQRIEREITSAEELIKKIDNDGETVGYMTIVIMVIAEKEEELSKRCKKIETKLSSMQMKIRCLASLVKNSFRCVAPFFSSDKKIKNIAKRNVPLSTFVGGLPFASSRI